MSDPDGDRVAITALTELRAALAAHGITLPSLDLHLPSYAASGTRPPLISLGNCNPATAQRIADALAGR
ncbi:hypothetical protein Slala03_32830 [Streptomyces lavendulae subsp. lavendulae]|uniref:hypothetical protein n=1 Tax=Streptomyces lavendulae TaxID=1914 RepID=UPI0024A10238|nr:hypothetical protein [Streptomyces lavendulae]GLV83594.1 hypothetical protein Slala03_32830 [Streptomyces lavendulae subsp. lavendulae]GLV98338.1 hypothetical protein Slala05_19700 [Streptomyces lavendulae subsp. lavendulae]